MIDYHRNTKLKDINPLGVVGKYIYHFFFVKFLGLEGIKLIQNIFRLKKDDILLVLSLCRLPGLWDFEYLNATIWNTFWHERVKQAFRERSEL